MKEETNVLNKLYELIEYNGRNDRMYETVMMIIFMMVMVRVNGDVGSCNTSSNNNNKNSSNTVCH